MRTRLIKIGAGAVVLAALAGGGVGWATSGDDDDQPATGPAAERARAAALAHVGGGTVIGVERESEGDAAWEVEVRRADGSVLELVLDERYSVVADATEGADDGEEPGE